MGLRYRYTERGMLCKDGSSNWSDVSPHSGKAPPSE